MKIDIIERKDRIIYLPLSKITPCRTQPRRNFPDAELNELALSIKENGVLQPITVRRVSAGYEVVAGERRLRASHIAGLSKIPCIVINADEKKSATLALLENLQRQDLGFFEEAEGIAHLMKVCSYTQEDVAKKLGKSRASISNKLRLLRLGKDFISKILANSLTERHARALLRLNSREERDSALNYIIEKKLNVRDTDEYIDSLIEQRKKPKKETNRSNERFVIKDVRLFYNTVGRAVDTMRRAGFRTDIVRNEDDEAISMSIKIFK